jgi:hypothetical protein
MAKWQWGEMAKGKMTKGKMGKGEMAKIAGEMAKGEVGKGEMGINRQDRHHRLAKTWTPSGDLTQRGR